MLPAIFAGGLAAAGALGNWLGNNADAERAAEAYNRIQGLAESTGAANEQDIQSYRNLVANTYGQGAANYQQALEKFLNSPVYQNESFSFNDDISNYMDPAANQRLDAALNAINNNAASNGSRFSSDYNSRLGAAAQAQTSQEWEKAYNRLQQARQQAANEYQLNSQNNWNNYNAQVARDQFGVNAYGNDRNQYINGLSDAMSAEIANHTGILDAQAQAIAGTANAKQGTSGWDLLGGLGGAGGQFLTSWFGGK